MSKKSFLLLCVGHLFFSSCAFRPGAYSPTSVPPAPDYSMAKNWAALPEKNDPADRVPDEEGLTDRQAEAPADVFFLHPTTYTRKGIGWNASLHDKKLNQKTDQTTILYQASLFNGSGRVYAPRYRQAHLLSFYTKDKKAAQAALDTAYHDVRNAFSYYLEHYNNGRPVIIAAHSQGARHAKILLKEFFDGRPLQQQLVAAYVVGWPVLKSEFENIPVCARPDQTGCICSWRTFKYGYEPPSFPKGDSIVVVNPLSWDTATVLVPKTVNKGAVLRNFDKVLPGIADARVHNGLLWAHKPRFPGSFLFSRKNYHIVDLNLYYLDVRENARRRVESYLKRKQ